MMKFLFGLFGLFIATAANAATPSMDSLILIPGSAPGSPTNGQLWMTSSGLFGRVAGSTVGPYGTGGSSGLTIASTTIAGGTTTRVLFDNAGILGEYTITGTGNVVMSTSPTLVSPALGTPSAVNLVNATNYPKGSSSTFGVMECDNTTVTCPGGVLSSVGGAATAITPGTTTVVGATAPCFLVNSASTTLACDALGPTLAINSNIINTAITDTVHTTSATTANIGGQDDYNGSSITATLATLAAGQTVVITDQNASALTVALGGQTVVGLPLATTLHTGGFYGFTFNSLGGLSGFGSPGFGTITTNALCKFLDGTGACTASGLTDNGTTISTAEAVTLTGISAGTIASGKNLGLDSSNHLVVATVSGGGGGGGTFNYSDNGVTLSGTAYAPIGGGGAPQSTEANVDVASPSALTVTNLQVSLSAAPGVGNSIAITLRDGAASQAVTCTISGASATSCSDLTHSFNVAQGDLIDWQIVTTGTIVGTPTITIAANNGTSNVGVTSIAAGTGLSGGTITTSGTVAIANTAVTPGSYTSLNATINAQGQITAAANGSGGSGATTLISTLTANNTAASLAWTGLIGNEYTLRCANLIAGNTTNNLVVQFGEGATPTWKTTGYNQQGAIQSSSASPTALNFTNGPGFWNFATASSGTIGTSASVDFHALSSSTAAKTATSAIFLEQDSGTDYWINVSGRYTTDTATVTAIRVIDTDTHNLVTGYCSLYAVAN